MEMYGRRPQSGTIIYRKQLSNTLSAVYARTCFSSALVKRIGLSDQRYASAAKCVGTSVAKCVPLSRAKQFAPRWCERSEFHSGLPMRDS